MSLLRTHNVEVGGGEEGIVLIPPTCVSVFRVRKRNW